jgi:hypothetical protein
VKKPLNKNVSFSKSMVLVPEPSPVKTEDKADFEN